MKSFRQAADSLALVNVKTHKDLLPAVLDLLAQKYPEFRDEENPEMFEELQEQLGRKGFCYALKDSSSGEVKGFAAGVTYATDTAVITYIVAPEGDDAATEKLKTQTLKSLQKGREIEGVFIEIYDDTHTENAARNQAEQDLYRDLCAIKVPIAYQQPLEADSDTAIPGLELHVLFTKPFSPIQRKVIILDHLTAFTKSYDPDLENPKNVANLARYGTELNEASWRMFVEPSAPRLKQ